MVFETLVSDLLNRFIGDYVENLDKSQLKIGIWGGNVVLENLRVKENALSEFDVPFKVKAGQIGKLTLKIPWKNLYNEAVVATLDGLYLLVVPGATIKYDPVKEERYQQEAKQKELQRIEETLQLVARRGSQAGEFVFNLESYVYKNPPQDKGRKLKKRKKPFRRSKKYEHKAEKPQEEKKDTFAEKLATQVIKNLQVKITSIHIRYEDDVSDPQRPLAMGMTLSELSLQTADENWKPCILNEAAKIIYKLGRLECFCAYWNVNGPIFYRGSWEEIVDKLKVGISTKNEELQGYQYIFKPIFASARMCINPNAEVELKSPKANLHLEVQNIAIEMTKPQYMSMVDLLESIDCMVKNSPYRKFRPDVPVHRNARQWWKYSISSILEVHIRHFNQMWDWNNIKKHRHTLKAYKAAYKIKLTQGKVREDTEKQIQDEWDWNNIKKHRHTLKAYKAAYKIKLTQGKVREDTEKQIQELEKVLDVFNIVLARQQIQMEVVRSGQKLVAKKAATQKQSGGGFFSSFFGKKEGKKKEEEEDKEPKNIDSIMTPEEKTKFYTAIGYSGSSHNLALPKHYVAVIVNFKLLSTSVTFREEPGVPEILKVQMIDLSTSISQRPGAQAIRVEAKLEHWYVTGLQQQGEVPSLIASVGDSDSSLLSVLFELNPEDSPADQLLRVHSQPVEIIYDALTVISITEFFKMGKRVDLEVLTSATLSKLEEIKEKTASGLSHIIETRKVLDLRIDLKPSYLLLPKSGFYDSKSDLMIVDFGYLQLNSVDQGSHQQVSASFSSLEEIMDRAYERYSLELRSVQILYSKSGEKWKNARVKGFTYQHILQPMDVTLQLAKCMVDKDSRMPRFKVSGELPLLHVKISDQKIQGVLELVDSIPLPQTTSSPPSTPTEKVLGMPLSDARPKVLGLDPKVLSYTVESDSEEDTSEKSADEDSLRSTLEELTEVQFQFEVKAVLLELTRQAAQEDVVLAFNVSQLGAEGKIRTFDLTVTSYLRKISLDYCEIKDAQNQPLHLITSSDKHGSDLLKVEYIKADVNGPSFHTILNNTEQALKVEFSSLDFLLHTKALLSTINYMNSAIPQDLTASKDRDTKRRAERAAAGKTVSKGSKDSGVVNFKLSAVLGSFRVAVCDDRSNIADIRVQGIDASVVVQAKETDVFARLRDIVVLDVDPKTIHKKAVSIVGEEVFSFKMTLYPGATEGEGYTDTSKVDGKVILRLGCIQIVYLHKFLTSLLMFVDNFQTAKEALSAATAQAAEKAASSVRDFAQKSFRLAMDIRLKAPLIIIPQSSTSHNAFVVDLGLITVGNSFSLLAAEGFPLPAVLETMDVKLTQLKLSRTVLKRDAAHLDVEILEPINLELLVKRNLATTWYNKIPGMEVNGVLMSMNMALGQEDVGVLMRILAENIGEGSRAAAVEGIKASAKNEAVDEGLIKTLPVGTGSQPALTSGAFSENVVNVLLNFEIKEVMLRLKKSKNGKEYPFLVLHVAQLGIDTKVRKYDMEATTYIKNISMKCLEFLDSNGEPLCIISSSAESGADLLEVKYFQADRNGPNFASLYQNTEQKINVVFSSLDLMLHTEALLSTMDFLSAALSNSSLPSPERESKKSEDMRTTSAKSTALSSPSDGDVIDLMVNMQLGAFNVLVCDQKSNMADIKIQGLDGSLKMQGTQTHMYTRLRDFIIMNVDPKTIHKKAISIVGDEVFSFSMSLTPKATEGAGYTDTSKVDGKVKLNVGCIQVVYLHKFVMSLLNFSNNFQAAKEALSAATAQAAEKAASSVRDFAQKSFRLAMNIRLKAPLIIIPQSSTSHNAVEADLGLITVGNSFSLLPVEGRPLPAVIDNMDIQLTQLKLSRISMEQDSNQPSSKLLEPVNLVLSVKRNLAASWYQKMAAIEVDGDLKPMKVSLSQDDLTISPIILNTVITITAAMAPRPKEEPSQQTSDDLNSLWSLMNVANASYWFLGVDTASEVTESFKDVDSSKDGESFEMNVKVVQVTLESGLGHRTVPLLLAESSFTGTAQNWSSLLSVSADMTLEVNYFNETHAIWEPLLERVDNGRRRWNLKLDMKNNPVRDKSPVPGDDFIMLPDPRTAITICSKDTMNITVSKCCLSVFNNLAKGVKCKLLEGNKVITVRSPLQIKNHFYVPFAILKYSSELGGMVNVGVAEPEKECHVPLEAYRSQLFLLPVGPLEDLYRASSTCVTWKEQVHVSSEVHAVLQCPAIDSSFLPLVVNTLAMPDDLSHIASHGEGDWDPAYVIHLHPAVTLKNLLPYSIRYLLEGSADFCELQEGSAADVLNSNVGGEIIELVLIKYQGRNWTGRMRISREMPEFLSICFTCDTPEGLTVDLCVHVSRVCGKMVLSVYSPYWIINKTSRVLQYRAEDTCVKHPSNYRDVILFSFKKKNFFSKNKLQLCVSTSSWSDGFSLDTVGSYGCVRCPDKNGDYLVGVSIQMSSFNLTRIVTMSPFYTLVNKSLFELEVGEVQNNNGFGCKWHYISSTECLPFWPEASTGKLCVRVVGSESSSKSFFFNKQDNGTLLRMEQYGGVIVDVNISDHSTVISFTDYYDGAAPALVVNHTPAATVNFRQRGCEESWALRPGEAQRFAWDDPAGVRKLCWSCQDHSGELDLVKDESGQFAYSSLVQIHWVSFLDGRQRVLIFTEDVGIVTKARQAEELEQFQQEVNISLKNLGLSLINNDIRQEIAYVGITSSGVVWEMRPKNRWKSFNHKNIGLLEKAYQDYINSKSESGWTRLETGLEVNFGRLPMLMRQPFSCTIRRNFLPGIRIELKQSPHQRSLRAQLYWLQVDNQLPGAIFPTVFHPVPLPKSIVQDSEPKPFIDVSIITRFNEHSQVMQFNIQMSSFNLTRIVTMSPFYTLVNKSLFELEVGEVQNNNGFGCKWHYISSTECLPFWPEASTGKLCVRVVGSESSSKSFFFNKQDNGTLLRMEQYGGVIVDVNISDHSTVISFTDYYDGAAPALVVNHTPAATVNFRQRGCEESWALRPGEAQRFAWDDPAGVRKLCWSCQDHSGELDLVKDESGQFAYSSLVQIHWVSFLDGRQRVLIFTEDVGIVTKARQAEELEQFQQEVNISLKNLGLSLINNDIRQEIAYVGITSSGVVWEMRPKNRWKSFNHKNIGLLEKAYQDYINSKSESGWTRLETGLEVNFGRLPMLMRQPFSCTIRRNFLPGIRIELKQSPHQRSLRAQLYWLQVDNQLPGAIFPTVFHPVPLPKSIVQDSEPKPFFDVSIITRFNEHSQVMQFKYFMALVQEMAVKIDQGFLGAILALFNPATDSQDTKEKNKLIERDLEALQAQLMETSMTDASGLSFFEHFHISPIKLHLSLSLGSSGDESEQGDMVAIQSVNLLLKSIGATLTDVDDLIFKLAYFEVKYQFYRREKLMWAVIRHYTEQFLTQMYVLVLGLDVLGNPFGLIRGLSEGVEAFFYEPIQGAVQGPEEFAEGFVIGVRSLLGHTVGGAAGMVSRITGTVGKGLAAITMDKDYQQKRREEMNRPTKDFGESLAKGGKGFLKGVVGGVTGIVTKPVEGAKKEGAAGFFKGIGKGLVGVVARPTGGIVDMASSTFQGIQRSNQRVAESTEEVTKLRPVRLIQEDGIIQPYDHHESEGFDLFQRSEIKQLDGEIFRGHYEYPGHRKTNILITNRRVMCVKEIDVIGHFNKEWECQFENFQRPPSTEGGDLKIYYREQNKLNLIRKDGQMLVKVIHMRDAGTAERLREGIDSAQSARKQYQMARQKSQRFIKTGNV
ncbi:vacuolar protein sorting-associated protein 13C-like [Sinocyclocheilus grahami]|nr:PREDICTED: vacuolar protein sorting-associated protein 13C-like [Sinocyclocheilus grahami]